MQKLYLDCDGVILDTIKNSYQMLKEKNITEAKEAAKFYENIDWNELILLSGEINNSISKIKILSEHFNVEILTHVFSDKEAQAKIKYFKKELPQIGVIAVPKSTEKADMVNPEGAILVDDFYPNLEKWEKKGGIPVKFSDSDKKHNCITISDLIELLDISF